MLDTIPRTYHQQLAQHLAPTIIKAVYAKVATSGTINRPRYETVRVLFERGCDNAGWWSVLDNAGRVWYCHRDDMVQLYPIVSLEALPCKE